MPFDLLSRCSLYLALLPLPCGAPLPRGAPLTSPVGGPLISLNRPLTNRCSLTLRCSLNLAPPVSGSTVFNFALCIGRLTAMSDFCTSRHVRLIGWEVADRLYDSGPLKWLLCLLDPTSHSWLSSSWMEYESASAPFKSGGNLSGLPDFYYSMQAVDRHEWDLGLGGRYHFKGPQSHHYIGNFRSDHTSMPAWKIKVLNPLGYFNWNWHRMLLKLQLVWSIILVCADLKSWDIFCLLLNFISQVSQFCLILRKLHLEAIANNH